jgi:hypothetical protein
MTARAHRSNVKGYGTTWSGPGNCLDCGTLFSVSKAGKEQVLRGLRYHTRRRGRIPAGLINTDGTLCGTALTAGRYQGGVDFTFIPYTASESIRGAH